MITVPRHVDVRTTNLNGIFWHERVHRRVFFFFRSTSEAEPSSALHSLVSRVSSFLRGSVIEFSIISCGRPSDGGPSFVFQSPSCLWRRILLWEKPREKNGRTCKSPLITASFSSRPAQSYLFLVYTATSSVLRAHLVDGGALFKRPDNFPPDFSCWQFCQPEPSIIILIV